MKNTDPIYFEPIDDDDDVSYSAYKYDSKFGLIWIPNCYIGYIIEKIPGRTGKWQKQGNKIFITEGMWKELLNKCIKMGNIRRKYNNNWIDQEDTATWDSYKFKG